MAGRCPWRHLSQSVCLSLLFLLLLLRGQEGNAFVLSLTSTMMCCPTTEPKKNRTNPPWTETPKTVRQNKPFRYVGRKSLSNHPEPTLSAANLPQAAYGGKGAF